MDFTQRQYAYLSFLPFMKRFPVSLRGFGREIGDCFPIATRHPSRLRDTDSIGGRTRLQIIHFTCCAAHDFSGNVQMICPQS
jgi:hypothetical protein